MPKNKTKEITMEEIKLLLLKAGFVFATDHNPKQTVKVKVKKPTYSNGIVIYNEGSTRGIKIK